MGTTSMYVLQRRLNPSLMDQNDWDRLEKATAKRNRKGERHAKKKEQPKQVDD